MSDEMILHAVQAHAGDCLLLEAKRGGARRFALVDGGPARTYDPHLRAALGELVGGSPAKLDLVVCSHVHDDHLRGLLDLLVESRSAVADGEEASVDVTEMWLDEFSVVTEGTDIEPRLDSLVATAAAVVSGNPAIASGVSLQEASHALLSIRQGHQLQREARLADIPVNASVPGHHVVADDGGRGPHDLLGLRMTVVGPTRSNLDALQRDWEKWLDDNEEALREGRFDLLAMEDESVPNLASIQLLAELDGRRLLLTGDGRGDHLLEALGEADLLDAGGGIDVDVLKVPHHGSDRNVDQDFFEKVRASVHVVSGDGKHGNPDLDTLRWIVKAARKRAADIVIACTNDTSSLRRLQEELPPAANGYRVELRDPSKSWLSVRV